MPIPIPAILQLVNLGIQAFSKKRKVRRVLEEMHGIGTNYQHFVAAREKIDIAEAAGKNVKLTIAETAALDFVMDRFASVAKRIKSKVKDKRPRKAKRKRKDKS